MASQAVPCHDGALWLAVCQLNWQHPLPASELGWSSEPMPCGSGMLLFFPVHPSCLGSHGCASQDIPGWCQAAITALCCDGNHWENLAAVSGKCSTAEVYPSTALSLSWTLNAALQSEKKTEKSGENLIVLLRHLHPSEPVLAVSPSLPSSFLLCDVLISAVGLTSKWLANTFHSSELIS